MKKGIAFILLLVMILAACASNTAEVDKNITDDYVSTDTTADDTRIQSSLPKNLNFNGTEINMWYFTKAVVDSERFLYLPGDLTGDIVDEALYSMNLAVEEQLNVKLNYYDNGQTSSETGATVVKLLMADIQDYDMFYVVQWNTAQLVTNNVFLNIYGNKYLDLEKPWWANNYMREMAIGKERIYFLCGDVSIDMIRCIACTYFNKKMYNDILGDPDEMYNTVLSGKWTMDLMMQYAETVYSDLNGDGIVNEGDRYGYVAGPIHTDGFIYGAGVRVTARDEEHVPYLVMNSERTISFTEKLYKALYETVGGSFIPENSLKFATDFKNDQILLLFGYFYTSENLRDMEIDYGIIPYPKYDEAQDTYLSVVHDIATLICLPNNCRKVDEVCAVLEAMAYYNYYNVSPKYYETALKTKYTRDQVSSQIIDILHANNTTDIAYVYGANFNQLGYLMREMIAGKKNNFVSLYDSKEKTAVTQMDKLIAQYLELD
ncbi:MAG: hypothetical protein FWF15_01825 [Oscillospiraceae bacterium]|nr:hypothetical protein [Oscillospiraceae bacterium]